jgi:hypothetical protein
MGMDVYGRKPSAPTGKYFRDKIRVTSVIRLDYTPRRRTVRAIS